MATRYQLNISNNSAQNTTFILFQKSPELNPWQSLSVVWLSKTMAAKSKSKFEWNNSYNFITGEQGLLQPGARFRISETRDCDPNSDNKIEVSVNGGRCNLSNTQRGGQPGELVLTTKPFNPYEGEFSAGIGMDNSAVIATRLQPNMNYIYSNMEYWIAFGNYENGQLLEPDVPNATRLIFPNGVTTMNAILKADNQFVFIYS